MQSPMTVTFLGIAHSDALEAEIRKRAKKLDGCCRDLVSCHVVLDLPHRHHEKGKTFSLRITATTRGDEFAVKREGVRDELRVVIRDAFDVVQRRLQKHDEKPRQSAAQATNV